jgi:hypothetical protein
MQTVQHITEGESYASIFAKLNTLIDGYNEMVAALGSALNNGTFDYNSLSNRPSINNHVLQGNQTQTQLGISIDDETLEAIDQIADRVGDVESGLNNKVNTTDLPTALVAAGYKTQTQLEEVFPLISGLATRLSGLGYKTQTELGTAGFKTQTQLEEVFPLISGLATRLSGLGYKTQTELGTAGFKTQTQLEEVFPLISGLATRLSTLGFKTQTQLEEVFPLISGLATRLSGLGYKTLTELGSLGYKTQTELNNAGYRTVTEIAVLGYRTLTELDTAGYYKKPSGGIPVGDMAVNLQDKVDICLNAANSAAVSNNANLISDVQAMKTTVGDNSSGMKKDVNDVKTEIGNVGVNESITKDLDLTRKFINAVVDIAIACKNEDPRVFVNTLADKTKLIVK